MKVLQVNNTDLPGARFNGFSLLEKQSEYNIDIDQVVIDKWSTNDRVHVVDINKKVFKIIRNFEQKHSLKAVCNCTGHLVAEMPVFKSADIVHYHLIHNEICSLSELPYLIKLKKSIWTIHDPWILTGHCIYPLDCDKFLFGCSNCPSLDRHFKVKKDTTDLQWEMKRRILSKLDLDIIVSTNWMKNLLEKSPITKNWKRIHVIPFGIDLNRFLPPSEARKSDLKRMYFDNENFTIAFREDPSLYKGLNHILEVLKHLRFDKKVNILTVGKKNLIKSLDGKYNIKELGWINDEIEMANFYSCPDLFLMPSEAESFGVMAIESLATGVPVIAQSGTALSELIGSPSAGLEFKKGNMSEFAEAIMQIYSESKYSNKRNKECRKLAESRFDDRIYFDNLLKIYNSIL